jgi:hypothetical protein
MTAGASWRCCGELAGTSVSIKMESNAFPPESTQVSESGPGHPFCCCAGSFRLIQKGVPPALPGRQQQFDIFGSPSKKLQEVSRQAHIKENLDGRV